MTAAATRPTVHTDTEHNITTITGQVRSGKSRQALRIAERHDGDVFVVLCKETDNDAPWLETGAHVVRAHENSHIVIKAVLEMARAGDMVVMDEMGVYFAPESPGGLIVSLMAGPVSVAMNRGVHIVAVSEIVELS